MQITHSTITNPNSIKLKKKSIDTLFFCMCVFPMAGTTPFQEECEVPILEFSAYQHRFYSKESSESKGEDASASGFDNEARF